MLEPVKLRGHHLLCILSYVGRGYGESFTKNFDGLVKRINLGAEIEIVSGADDICGPLQTNAAKLCEHADHCHQDKIKAYDVAALTEISRVLQTHPMLKAGARLKLGKSEIKFLREQFAKGAIRRACTRCEWSAVCSDIAAQNFHGVRLIPAAIPQRVMRYKAITAPVSTGAVITIK